MIANAQIKEELDCQLSSVDGGIATAYKIKVVLAFVISWLKRKYHLPPMRNYILMYS